MNDNKIEGYLEVIKNGKWETPNRMSPDELAEYQRDLEEYRQGVNDEIEF